MHHLDLARETNMDKDHRQGAQIHPPPQATEGGSSPIRSCRLSVTGLSFQPTWPGLSILPVPDLPCGEQSWPVGAHWRSLWRDFGSEKLWMKERQGSIAGGTQPRSEGAEVAPLPGCCNSWCSGSSSLQDGTRLAPPIRPAWLPGTYVLPWPQGTSLRPALRPRGEREVGGAQEWGGCGQSRGEKVAGERWRRQWTY